MARKQSIIMTAKEKAVKVKTAKAALKAAEKVSDTLYKAESKEQTELAKKYSKLIIASEKEESNAYQALCSLEDTQCST